MKTKKKSPWDIARVKAEEIWDNSKGRISCSDIAKSLGVAPGTVRQWKVRYNWKSYGVYQEAHMTKEMKEQDAENRRKERDEELRVKKLRDCGLNKKYYSRTNMSLTNPNSTKGVLFLKEANKPKLPDADALAPNGEPADDATLLAILEENIAILQSNVRCAQSIIDPEELVSPEYVNGLCNQMKTINSFVRTYMDVKSNRGDLHREEQLIRIEKMRKELDSDGEKLVINISPEYVEGDDPDIEPMGLPDADFSEFDEAGDYDGE